MVELLNCFFDFFVDRLLFPGLTALATVYPDFSGLRSKVELLLGFFPAKKNQHSLFFIPITKLLYESTFLILCFRVSLHSNCSLQQ
jgi:hypothetical protein